MPWIFAEARAVGGAAAPPVVNIEETGLRFLELLAQYQPSEFHLSRARRFFVYFCGNLKWAHYLNTMLNREQSLAGIERVWMAYFAEHPEEI
jgi:tRNA-dihydrouridine synthase